MTNCSHKDLFPGDYPYVRGARVADNTWLVRQDITVKDYSEANAKALDILMKGVTSLGFIIDDPETITADKYHLLLSGIHCESVELNFSTPGKAKGAAGITSVGNVGLREQTCRRCSASIAADPLGRLIANGKLCVTVEEGLITLLTLQESQSASPALRCVNPSGTLFSNAGAGPVAELAYTLSLGNEYMASPHCTGAYSLTLQPHR